MKYFFEVKEGWGPLCKFLDVPVPNIPFPNTDDISPNLEANNSFSLLVLLYQTNRYMFVKILIYDNTYTTLFISMHMQ